MTAAAILAAYVAVLLVVWALLYAHGQREAREGFK